MHVPLAYLAGHFGYELPIPESVLAQLMALGGRLYGKTKVCHTHSIAGNACVRLRRCWGNEPYCHVRHCRRFMPGDDTLIIDIESGQVLESQ